MNGETENKKIVQREQEAVRQAQEKAGWLKSKEEEWDKAQKKKHEEVIYGDTFRDPVTLKLKFEPKQAPRTPNLKPVIECIDNFYRANGYSVLPHDKKVALAYAIHVQIRKEGLYE